MNISETGRSILYNVMSIIDKMPPEECEAFKTSSMEKRKQPKYYRLFQHLKEKSDAGTSAEEISEDEVRAWAERKTNLTASYSDLIENLQKKLLDFIGQRYAERQAESWYAEVNQLLDQADGLIEMGLRHHAKILIDKALSFFEDRFKEYQHHQWDTTIGRLCFTKWRYSQSRSDKTITWTEEMEEMVRNLAQWNVYKGLRKMNDAITQEREAATEWRAETMLLAIMRLHAEHFGDKRGELEALRMQVKKPSGFSLRALHRRYQYQTPIEKPASPQEETLNDLERVFLRLYCHHKGIEIADENSRYDLSFSPGSTHPGIHFYPAATMWAMFQLQTHQLASQFTLPAPAKDDSDHQALSAWQTAMEREIIQLPLRLEFHQVLVLMGNCDFANALTRIRALLKLKSKQRQAILPQLKLLELLAEFENGNPNHWDIGIAFENYLSKKSGPEWEFHKAFSKLMRNAPWIDHNSHGLISHMQEKAEFTEKIEAAANRFDPVHQLVLWLIRSWANGEGRKSPDSPYW